KIRLVELMLSPRSTLAGRSLRDVSFRERYGTTVVAIWRDGEAMTTDIPDVPLRFGDGLLVHGTRAEIALLQDDPDFLVLTQELGRPLRVGRMVLASTIIFTALLLGIVGILTVAEALLSGAALLVLTRCITMEEVYRSIEWRAVVLIGAMLPMGLALQKTGAAEIVGDAIATAAGPFGETALLASLVLLTVTLAQMIPGGAAVPLVIIPLAVAAANQVGADPRMFAMAIALGASTAMLTPHAHPVGAMVMGLGGYSVTDYVKTGLPIVVMSTLLIIFLIPVIWAL
ncbi:MAG: SLC13 family permease, partial [Thermoanaerobaculia bacterium]|nr:SLC13 family permease [Thermoanaerobaculia bacterium]